MIPKITAIVSAYYCVEYLDGRIENLLEQDAELLIAVVAQKGSEEESIARKYPVRVITTFNIPTVYDAWNTAINATDSEYITNANSDDRHHTGAINVLAGMLDDHPDVAISYFDIDRVNEIEGDPFGQFKWANGGLQELINGCFLGPMPMWRRSLHEKYGLFDPEYHVAGDYEFWMRIAAGGEKFWHIKSIVGSHLEKKDCLEHRSPVRTIWETANARLRYRSHA